MPQSSLPGPDQIGPYRILDLLGEGGMGVVYRAEQTEPVRREVALKLIRGETDSEQVVARFELERQTLALMEHPFIARVLDAGTLDSDHPYFVMELVDGESITRFADRHRLSVRERLELFHDVCLAVQHAHSKGIIHRDLKPSNVVVAMQDGEATPKVIDFGIAEAIGVQLTEHTLTTRSGQALGTPEYMSPEQVTAGRSVDMRTDVYSLGVLLYELLTGRRPLHTERLRWRELTEAIRSEEPERPSMVVARDDVRPSSEVAELRRTSRQSLRQKLSGDVDTIVLKALRKEPDRRYQTVEQLASDVRRCLDGQPVVASEDSWPYRTDRFVRSHRVTVGVAAGVLLLIVAFAVWMTVQSTRIARERDRAVPTEQQVP
jgi:non-specific serine/threonine protein kinase/serine/threonine-protein kinase